MEIANFGQDAGFYAAPESAAGKPQGLLARSYRPTGNSEGEIGQFPWGEMTDKAGDRAGGIREKHLEYQQKRSLGKPTMMPLHTFVEICY